MADVSMMGASLDKCAMAFVDRTRQLKSLVLLRSSGPSEQTDQILEELEAALVKAERTMYQLKSKIGEETQAVRLAEALAAKSKMQVAQLNHVKDHLPRSIRERLAEVKREEEFDPEAKSRRISNQHGHADKENAPANGEVARIVPRSVPNVDESEFEGVPGYLKGRSSVERVNEAIKELNGLLSSRDHLMAQNLSKLSNLQIKQVNTWKEMDSDSTRPAGTVTILESDLKGTSLRLGEASSKDVINVLRHLQKLKEIRTAAGEKAYVCLTA